MLASSLSLIWAYSIAVERLHGMEEVGVRLPVGPQTTKSHTLSILAFLGGQAIIAGNVSFPCFEEGIRKVSRPRGREGWFTCLVKRIKDSMAKKLYVGGLPYSTTENELKDAFAQAGAVDSAIIIMDKMSGRSKGFGFVEYASDEDAQKGIDMWNGKDFGGRTLTVNEARPMEERPRRESRGGWGGGNRGGNNW